MNDDFFKECGVQHPLYSYIKCIRKGGRCHLSHIGIVEYRSGERDFISWNNEDILPQPKLWSKK